MTRGSISYLSFNFPSYFLTFPLLYFPFCSTKFLYVSLFAALQVTRLMRVSCGGVIGFSIVAIIIVIIGIAVCLNPSKPNRVSPVAEETSNITSRH
ncbi:hypothetical protein RRG08_002603 [Elysia crispata]|uniref:Uncharacterized protein n=1 Tax=Elysia crispata TaxID=231223 RepID=A0AAE1CSK2_9GAST|nr:hypothetical protein RRG08_002603 [Elysia crispata]